MRVLGLTFLWVVIARNWYSHLHRACPSSSAGLTRRGADFHPPYDWQTGLLQKYRDEEVHAPAKGTPEPPSREQLGLKAA